MNSGQVGSGVPRGGPESLFPGEISGRSDVAPAPPPQARYLIGDVRARLQDLEDNSVDLVMTSPPFLALRSYLPADHPDKHLEIGSEPDPGTFIDTMMQLVDDLARVLAPHGSMVFEFGDTYSGSGGAGGDYNDDGLREGQQKFSGSAAKRAANGVGDEYRPSRSGRVADAWTRAKSLALIPELFRVTLAYGTNPLTGRQWWTGNDRWMVRNVVRWVRPNPPVGALGDKFRPATSDLAVFTRDPKRWFDLDAVRSPHKSDPTKYTGNGYTKGNPSGEGEDNEMPGNPAGAPPLDWWNITTAGYPGSHYAVYPPELCVIPVKSMCPERVCVMCGEPSRRITGDTEEYAQFKRENQWASGGLVTSNLHRPQIDFSMSRTQTVGWSDCECSDDGTHWRNGVVLDPFAGSGTTLAVATGHGRDAIGVDLDERNADLALDRVGPLFLQVEP